MRPYASTDEHPAFLYDGHHRNVGCRRAHRKLRDQTMRRYQRKSARAEAHRIERTERAAWAATPAANEVENDVRAA